MDGPISQAGNAENVTSFFRHSKSVNVKIIFWHRLHHKT